MALKKFSFFAKFRSKCTYSLNDQSRNLENKDIWNTAIEGMVDRLTGKATNYYLIENDSIESYTCSSRIEVRDENAAILEYQSYDDATHDH
ncbi:5727_t:CDS:2 [Funneliformis mosseae]|uniref:5727_t:CDS:1 n=1 Tax=Funneliformis mosseae TaxID=27381 RepID=A0A9N9GTN0_FUNMO|nr:5727_t:CDS:2 [Funneliformis mosseae]